MKTPKEIILETHQATASRLDRIREDVLAAELGGTAAVSAMGQNRKNTFAAIPVKLWNELIWPSRRAWAGLAAVWVALAVVHFAVQAPSHSASPAAEARFAAEWNEQQQLLAILQASRAQVATNTPIPAAPPPPASGKSACWPVKNPILFA